MREEWGEHIHAKSTIVTVYKVFSHKLDVHRSALALPTYTGPKPFASPLTVTPTSCHCFPFQWKQWHLPAGNKLN